MKPPRISCRIIIMDNLSRRRRCTNFELTRTVPNVARPQRCREIKKLTIFETGRTVPNVAPVFELLRRTIRGKAGFYRQRREQYDQTTSNAASKDPLIIPLFF